MLEMIDGAPAAYQPGVCNIGPAEIRRRRQIGWLGLIGAVGLASLLLVVGAPTWSLLAVALPVAASASGFLQARLRFCAGFGLAGLQNFGGLGEEQRVAGAEARAADRRAALRIHAAAVGVGLGVAAILMLLPL